jgi:hypothetical protein
MSGLGSDDADSTWRSDSHQVTREHFGSLLLIALITFGALLAGVAMAGLVRAQQSGLWAGDILRHTPTPVLSLE